MTDEDRVYHPLPERRRPGRRALTAKELEQVKALCKSLRDRNRGPVDVSDMGVPHVSEER